MNRRSYLKASSVGIGIPLAGCMDVVDGSFDTIFEETLSPGLYSFDIDINNDRDMRFKAPAPRLDYRNPLTFRNKMLFALIDPNKGPSDALIATNFYDDERYPSLYGESGAPAPAENRLIDDGFFSDDEYDSYTFGGISDGEYKLLLMFTSEPYNRHLGWEDKLDFEETFKIMARNPRISGAEEPPPLFWIGNANRRLRERFDSDWVDYKEWEGEKITENIIGGHSPSFVNSLIAPAIFTQEVMELTDYDREDIREEVDLFVEHGKIAAIYTYMRSIYIETSEFISSVIATAITIKFDAFDLVQDQLKDTIQDLLQDSIQLDIGPIISESENSIDFMTIVHGNEEFNQLPEISIEAKFIVSASIENLIPYVISPSSVELYEDPLIVEI